MTKIQSTFAHHGFIRSSRDGLLGGVCAGVGRRFGLTPWTARVLFMLLLLVPGSQLLVYPVLWLLMPAEESVTTPAATSYQAA